MTSLAPPAAEMLRRNRITTADLAAACRSTPEAIAAQLAGRAPMAHDTLEALRRLVGPLVADEVQWTATRARTAYLSGRS